MHDLQFPPPKDGSPGVAPWQADAHALGLTERELAIIGLVLADEEECSIARRLKVSRHTVHAQLQRLYRKLRATSRVELVLRVLAAGAEATGRRPQGTRRPLFWCYRSPHRMAQFSGWKMSGAVCYDRRARQ